MSSLPRPNVLIVDDEPHGLTAMKRLLEGVDRNIVAVASGSAALREVLRTDFALILLDVRMPVMDGFETAALIRERRQSRHTPIVFLTAAIDDVDSMFRGYQVGAVDYLLKPVDPNILRAKVAVFIELFVKTAQLGDEIRQRELAEGELSRVNATLELKIRERTASLVAANEQLRREVDIRSQVEEELRSAKQAAEAANLAKSAFLANMSHEIRTPMNAIIGMTEIALRTELSGEQRQYLELAKAASESLLTIINDILDFSKIEAGRLEMETAPFSLREALSDMMKTLALQAHGKGLELVYEVAPDTPDSLVADAIRLRQIVMNLVANAIKFTEQGEVVVRVWPEVIGDGQVTCHFAVTDTGIGIAPEKQSIIFAPFQQADTLTTRLYGGTGLGLTIAARLVQMMDGRIWVESRLGSGSTFHFLARFDLQTAPELVRDAIDFSGVKALVVEDHATSRQVLVNMLRRWNVDVHEAASGDAALRCVDAATESNAPFALVLLDESLPGFEVRELAAQMREMAGAALHTILLITSALPSEADGMRGADGICRVARPLTHDELKNALAMVSGVVPQESAHVASSETLRSDLTILLVEDNAINRKLAEVVLEREGHRVIAVENGAAALEALQRSRFDIVLMDLQMPRMDGLETTRAIRQRERATGEHVPIIALTAHAMAGDRARCLEAGMDAYLTKPVQPAMLLRAIGRPDRYMERSALQPATRVVLDRAELVDRVDGDPGLLDEIIKLFFDNHGRLMTEARHAMTEGDIDRFGIAVHTLNGMFRNLAARATQDLCGLLETLDLASERERAQTIWVLLEQEVQALNAELANLLYEWTATEKEAAD